MARKINIKQYINTQKLFPAIIDTPGMDKIKLYTKPIIITSTLDDKQKQDVPELDDKVLLPVDVATTSDLRAYMDSFNGDEDDIENKKKDKKNHSFQSVSGTAEGMQFDSKWEYAYYIYVKYILGYSIERNTTSYLYYSDAAGKRRKFFYDFVVNGCPYEVKGIFRANDIIKMEQCPQVTFVFGEEMKKILKEVKKEFPDWEKAFIAN